LSATKDDLIAAAKQAQIHEPIMKFPNGYDNVVGERGLKLSGGEKQRMSVARAILKKDAPILLCDEPTSSLDSETEAQIMQNIKNIDHNSGERTIVMIAHRLSTIQDSDMIIVMDQGRVLEHGTHNELLAMRKRYSDLWRFQEATPTDLL
jgi:ABC-type multidrug transport system fused ATPase/permease subunit